MQGDMPVARSFEAWMDLLFAAVIEDDKKSPGQFLQLGTIADSLGYEYPAGWVDKASQILENRGWIQARRPVRAIDAGVMVRLTGNGFLAFEKEPIRGIDRSKVTPVVNGRV